MDSMKIVVSGDNRYLPGAVGTLASARMALDVDTHMEVEFLHENLEKSSQERLVLALSRIKGGVSINFRHLPSSMAAFPEFFFPSKLNYARLQIPNLLDWEKLVYIDIDILILKSLNEVASTDTPDSGLCAVIEKTMPTLSADPPASNMGLSINPDAGYFNSGFLVIDNKKLKNNKLFDRASRLLSSHESFGGWKSRCRDQSALNYMANGNFTTLDSSWNRQIHRFCFDPVETIPELSRRAINVHFVTKAKPWLTWCPYPAEEMFRILLDAVDPQWRTPEFNAREQSIRRKHRHAGSLSVCFHARAALKKTLGRDSASDARTAEFWSVCASDNRRLSQRAEEVDSLLEGWRKEIESKLA